MFLVLALWIFMGFLVVLCWFHGDLTADEALKLCKKY